MASRDPRWQSLVMLARSLGIEADFSVWSEIKEAVRGPYRGLDARLEMRGDEGRVWLVVSLAHSRRLNLGLHASPSRHPGSCDSCDLLARNRPLGAPELVGYADDRAGAETLLAAPGCAAAFATFATAGPTGSFVVHVNDAGVRVTLEPEQEPTRELLAAMYALSHALVSSSRLPDAPATPPFRRSFLARFLFILLAPLAGFLAVMGLFAAEPWMAYALIALGGAGLVWLVVRRWPGPLSRGR